MKHAMADQIQNNHIKLSNNRLSYWTNDISGALFVEY